MSPARRRFAFALAASIALHALIFSIPMKKKLEDTVLGSAPPMPMTVTILDKQSSPVEAAPPPAPKPQPTPPPPVITARRHTPEPRVLAPTPAPPEAVPEPRPEPRPAPPMDMSAMIEARRAQRRAAEAAVSANREPTPDELAQATIARNLQFNNRREGVGGVFQILRKSTRTAEFAFNGWRPNSERQWREVIEVDAGQGGDIDRAIVKRMIELIRTHYQGDFRWDSHRLGRVVVLSARPEDNEGLEEFLVREFFGTPTLGSGR